MIENGFKQDIKIKYSETDHNSVLKPFALLNFLQDIASAHADMKGFGYSFLYPRNMAWFLLKYHLEFDEYPVCSEVFTLVTEPRGYSRYFVRRDFEFWQSEKNIGKGTSLWVVIDRKTHSMLKPEEVFSNNPLMPVYQKLPDDIDFVKIKPIERADIEDTFKVRYNDLDINGHANNGNYIVWAFEPLDYDFKTNHRIKTLDIVYKKEAKYGTKLTVQVEYKDELTTVHSLKNEQNEELCLIQCSWV